MTKKITLRIVSPSRKDIVVKVPESLWKDFEQNAKGLGIPVNKAFEAAVDAYAKAKGIKTSSERGKS